MSARPANPRPSSPSGRRSSAHRATTRAASTGAATATAERPPRQITLRSILLLVMVLVAFVVLAPTVRAYVTQQEQLREVNATLAAAEDDLAALTGELEQWQDDDFVRAQARERFNYVEPGETSYRVIDPETVLGADPIADLTAEAQQEATGLTTGASGPWYVTVWDSIEIAGTAQSEAAEVEDEAADEAAPEDADEAGHEDTDEAPGTQEEAP